MKYFGVISLITLIALPSLFAQAPDTLWTKTYGGSSEECANSVQQTSDNGYIITGYVRSGGDLDVYFLKTDFLGNVMWTRTFGGSYDDYGYEVQKTNDNGFIIVGTTFSYGAGTGYVYLIKTDSSGNQQWSKTQFGEYGDENYGFSVKQTVEGGYIIAGSRKPYSGNRDVWLIKTNADGNTLWKRQFDNSYWDEGYSVAQTSDSGFIIAGYTTNGYKEMYVIKTGKNGLATWEKTFGYSGDAVAWCVNQTFDKGFVVAGYREIPIRNMYLLKLYENGNIQWTKTYGYTNRSEAKSIQQISDSGFIVAGYINPTANEDVWILRTDSHGDTLWSKSIGLDQGDVGKSAIQTSDEGYAIAGYSFRQSNSTDAYLIKLQSETSISNNPIRTPTVSDSIMLITPNPFISTIHIKGCAEAKIYDISGKFVVEAKNHWNGKDSNGYTVPPGIYFLKVNGKYIGKVVKVR